MSCHLSDGIAFIQDVYFIKLVFTTKWQENVTTSYSGLPKLHVAEDLFVLQANMKKHYYATIFNPFWKGLGGTALHIPQQTNRRLLK